MTAHILVPSLDEERPATLSRRIVTELLRQELGYEGVILSDDLEMKAIANQYSLEASAVLAIEAGCDGVLICSADYDGQAAALEALVHAVEEDRLRLSRVEDALKRQQRAKERFLAPALASSGRGGPRALTGRALRQAIGRDEHRIIADRMAQFL
jgi:beta-N-acetylhexosaminidase